MKILVGSATGTIGAAVTRALEPRHERWTRQPSAVESESGR